VALNTAISDFRKKKRSVPVSSTEGASIEIGQEPGNDIEKHDQADVLYAAIRQLPEIDKAIVMLYLEDKSYEEMEDILGINNNNLRVKMNRIKEKLRQLTKNISYGT
jgi:RNA polymerase sigma-70 factor (ECF subfamily)